MITFSLNLRTRRRIGLVAEFCPVCRDVLPFRFLRVATGQRLYGVIPAGEESVEGWEIECPRCRIRWPADVLRYAGVARRVAGDVLDLVDRTHPELPVRHRERLELESRLARGRLDPGDHDRRRGEAIAAIADSVAPSLGDLGADAPVLFALAVLLIGPMAVACGGWAAPHTSQAAGALAIAGCLLLAGALFTARTRVTRRSILPALVRSLAPLRPTPDELAAELDRIPPAVRRFFPGLDPAEIAARASVHVHEPADPVALAEILRRVPCPEASRRRGLLRAALLATEADLPARTQATLSQYRVDGPVALTALATAVLFAMSCAAAAGSGNTTWWLLVAACLGMFATFWALATSPSRLFARRALESLAHRLAPHDPTVAELAEGLAYLRTLGLRAGKVLDPQELRAAIARARPASRPAPLPEALPRPPEA